MRIFFSFINIAEDADNELANFKAWFYYAYYKSLDPKVCSNFDHYLMKYMYLLFNVVDNF